MSRRSPETREEIRAMMVANGLDPDKDIDDMSIEEWRKLMDLSYMREHGLSAEEYAEWMSEHRRRVGGGPVLIWRPESTDGPYV